jgi:hypothetical protein
MLKNPNPQEHASMSMFASSADYWRAQAEANAKDAERYRFLRDEDGAFDAFMDNYYNASGPADIDAAVDRAIATSGGAVGAA